MNKIEFSLILPCYNEGPTFEKSMGDIMAVLKSLKLSYEIIFIEDKSTDDTKRAVEGFVSKNKNTRAIYHGKNRGRGKSVSDGIKSAKGSICGYIDVDCEISPSYIPVFISEIEGGTDMAVGMRFYEKSLKSIVRVIFSKVYSLIVSTLLDIPIHDTESGYKFFNRSKILPILNKTRDRHWFWDTEICTRAHMAGLKIDELPVIFRKRPEKKSTVKIFSDSVDYLVKIYKFRNEINKIKISG